MRRALAIVLLVAAVGGGAGAAWGALLPGVKTPSRNIGCFYVPIRPGAHGNLLCAITTADYAKAAQARCIAPPIGLDWHGFSLPDRGRAQIVCAGGIMYDARDKPAYVVLAYGKSWHYRNFTCVSRRVGLTCTTRAGHGLFLSRESYRLW
jgi:hypothetical protein